MRAIVCGGRDYTNQSHLNFTLDKFAANSGLDFVIEGGALGADVLARTWAILRGIGYVTYKAQWEVHGRSRAGKIRNKLMITDGKPHFVIAFPGGPGTADMIKQAKQAGIPVYQIC